MPIDIKQLSQAYQYLPDATGLVDDTGNILFINQAFAELIDADTMVTTQDSLAQVFLLRKSQSNDWQSLLNTAIDQSCTVEVVIANKSNHLVSCRLHLQSIVDEGK